MTEYPNCKFNMVLCELFNPRIHGVDNSSDPNINGHYLVHSRYHNYQMIDSDAGTYFDDDDYTIYDLIPCFKAYIRQRGRVGPHDFIRNYKKIVLNKNYIKPEIAHCICLSGGECVAILKTFWLRIIQRAWKRVYKERSRIIRECYKNPAKFIQEKQTRFSKFNMPGLKGMLVKTQ